MNEERFHAIALTTITVLMVVVFGGWILFLLLRGDEFIAHLRSVL